MPKSLSIRSGLGSILFWSVISAAFIGPGSVTACAMAGAQFGLQLLWVLTFATFGTVWLQEAASRITIATGRDLGQTIALANQKRGKTVPYLLFFAVTFGCAAYQAGNILGAVSGLSLLTGWSARWLTIGVGAVCIILLAIGSTQWIANFLGIIVFAMGGAFVYVAFGASPPAIEVAKALVVPSYPAGSLLLINSLIGTTIVPYNLFFGSGITQGQTLSEMRLGVWIAVLLGGFISVVLLIAGLLITGGFTYPNMAAVLSERVGAWGGLLFAFGLFAAGFASSLTAPLAAAITGKSLLGWSERSWTYRLVWIGVLAVGLAFGLSDYNPVKIIVIVQAINGILLPVVTIFLFLAVNDRKLIPDGFRNSLSQNLAMLLVVVVSLIFGGWNVWLAVQSLFN
ncbi:NRAMP family divalent metal transporter [Larkinella rosea]|uniref:NRAMP family divalent metal transporter n=1 Tax=Larkinella rosea TaxID=2025312 RepID=UPI001E44AD38|nr:divalent metal cation transporter [Larkinella rosea]